MIKKSTQYQAVSLRTFKVIIKRATVTERLALSATSKYYESTELSQRPAECDDKLRTKPNLPETDARQGTQQHQAT